MRVLYLSLLLFFFSIQIGIAQNRCISTQEYLSPELKEKQREVDLEIYKRITEKNSGLFRIAEEEEYSIPVVVHVIHENGPENLSTAQVQQAIAYINDALTNSNSYSIVSGVNTKIRLCLASQDENNLPFSGIDYVYNPSLTNVAATNGVPADQALKNLKRQNPTKYMNIWIVKEIYEANVSGNDYSPAGYATGTGSHGTLDDGLVIEAKYFGGSTIPANIPNDIKVAVHEVGHYLGLAHTFDKGCKNNNCLVDGDKICDTPPEGTIGSLAACGLTRNSCLTDSDDSDPRNPFRLISLGGLGGQDDLSNNYMNYNRNECQTAFTQGQKERMRLMLETVRVSLLQSPGCGPACTSSITPNFTISTPQNAGQQITFTSTSSNATSFSWTVNGTNYTGSPLQYTFTGEGTYPVTLIASNTNPNCTKQIVKNVTVTCPVQAAFTSSATEINPGQSITFTSTSSSASSYEWIINGTSYVTTTNSFVYTFSAIGNYLVTLVASNGNCSKSSPPQAIKVGSCPVSKRNNIWYFAKNAGMDFNSGNPIALTNGMINIFTGSGESSSSVCDNNGNLLFYTDGIRVWNKNHAVMPNGTGLGGGASATQALIVPHPGNSQRYYIFSNDENEHFACQNGLSYSVVDISSNGGLGDVIYKNINLFPNGTEKVSATLHQNGHDIWVMGHRGNSNQFLAYKITDAGIVLSSDPLNPNPVVSAIGDVHNRREGQMKFSLNGKMLAVAIMGQSTQLFDFNDQSGTLSNLRSITGSPYGVEFSPDNTKLYVSDGGVSQYTIFATAAQIISSKVSITSSAVSALQLGPDNKIYVEVRNSDNFDQRYFLGAINEPNNQGTACGFQRRSVYLDINNNKSSYLNIGLPNFFNGYYNSSTLSIQGPSQLCISNSGNVTYKALASGTGTFNWSIVSGDASITSSSGNLASIHFNSVGNVKLLVSQVTTCGVFTSEMTITVWPAIAPGFLGDDKEYCPVGGSFAIWAPSNGLDWLWQDGFKGQGYPVTGPGDFWCEISNPGGCTTRDEIKVLPNVPVTNLNIGPPTMAKCSSTVVVLDAGPGFKTYTWNTGEKTQTITVWKDGTYSVTVTNGCGNTATDQITISNYAGATSSAISGPAALCSAANQTYSVNGPTGSSYVWKVPVGATIVSGQGTKSIVVNFGGNAGIVSVEETTTNGCKSGLISLPVALSNSTVSITTSNNEPTILIPGCHPSVTLLATSGFVSYKWYNGSTLISGATSSSFVASQAGVYKVEATNSLGCVSTSSTVEVINDISITGHGEICPGEKASMVVSVTGVIGRHFIQWIENGTLTTTPTGYVGNYYAKIVLPDYAPSCTLTTASFPVTLKDAPAPYVITNNGNLNICPAEGDKVTLTGTRPSNMSGISSAKWSSGDNIVLTDPSTMIEVTKSGAYGITTIGTNGCITKSNSYSVVAPVVNVSQECGQSGDFTLRASFNVPVTNYVWKNASGTVIGSNADQITVTDPGEYTVSTPDINCAVLGKATVCVPNNGGVANNMVSNGDFNLNNVSGYNCNNPLFESDLDCADASDVLTLSNWPSHYRITRNAQTENPTWLSASGLQKPTDPFDNYFLVADGRVTAASERVWSQKVNVEACGMYTFSAFVRDVIDEEGELPEVSLKIGESVIKRQIFHNSQPGWIEFKGTWQAPATEEVEISIMLAEGGWVGRDIGIDEVFFAKSNCLQVNNLGISSNAIANAGIDKFIGLGNSTRIGANKDNQPLSYLWEAPGGFTSTAANPVVSPTSTTVYTLTVTDQEGNYSKEKVTVSIIDPSISIKLISGANCTPQFKASSFNGTTLDQFQWYVNNTLTATNTTGLFNPTGIALGAVVKCKLITSYGAELFSNEVAMSGISLQSSPAGDDKAKCPGATLPIGKEAKAGMTYAWLPSTGLSSATVANPTVTNLSSQTTYTLTVTDANGCVETDQVTVSLSSAPAAPTITSQLCAGETGNVAVLVTGQGVYAELVSAPFTQYYNGVSYPGGLTVVGKVAYANADIVAKAINAEGCSTTVVVPGIVHPAITSAQATASPQQVCPGSSTQLNVSLTGGTAPFTYSWDGAGNSFSTIKNPVVAPLTNTTYYVQVVDAYGCMANANTTITMNPLPPTPTMTVSPTLICLNGTVSVSVNTPSAPITYTYTRPAGYTYLGGGGGQGGFGEGIRLSQSGNFVLTYTNTTTGCTNTTTIPVTASGNAYPVGTIPTTICAGASISVPYTVSSCVTLAAGNVFTAQLSDASGSFASPVNIGTLTSMVAGTINAIIPAGTPAGANYRIRIISSAPPFGVDNGVNITISSNCGGLTFDGSDDRVIIPHNAAYNIGTGNFTIEAWVKIPSGTVNLPVLSKRTVAGDGFLFHINLEGKKLLFNAGGVNYASSTLATSIFDNTCHHIAVTRSAATVTFYLDGTAIGTATTSSSINSTGSLYIGRDVPNGLTFNGTIDEVRFWNVAKTALEINSSKNVKVAGNTAGLIGNWDFNESSGQVVYDGSITSVNGSLGTNATAVDTQDPARATAGSCYIPTLQTGIAFDGVDDRAIIPTNAAYTSIGTGDFTMETWIKTSSTAQKPILSNRKSGNYTNTFLWITYSSATKFLLQINGNNYLTPSFPSIANGVCHHLAITRASGVLTFYIDGAAVGTMNGGGSIGAANNLTIGYDEYDNASISANINEVRFWNVAKTATEISNNRSMVLANGTANLIGYYKLKEPNGESIIDASAIANNGYLGSNASQFDAQNPIRNNSSCYSADRFSNEGESLIYLDSLVNESEVYVYPNPFTHETNIIVKGEEGKQSSIQVSDLNGRILEKLTIENNEKTCICQNLRTGVYILEVYSFGRRSVHKVVKLE